MKKTSKSSKEAEIKHLKEICSNLAENPLPDHNEYLSKLEKIILDTKSILFRWGGRESLYLKKGNEAFKFMLSFIECVYSHAQM